jgi:TorA maturation chaperone TorD
VLIGGDSLTKLAETAAVSFTKLFRGVNPHYSPPPPYESLYREGFSHVFSEPASEVGQEYRRFGFAPVDALGNEPPDHLSFELEFMYLLCDKEAEAWEAGNTEEAEQLYNAQREFLSTHLIRWAPKFFEEVKTRDTLGLFSALAEFAGCWLKLEHEQHLAEDGE